MFIICVLCFAFNSVNAQSWNDNEEMPFSGGLTFEYQAVEDAFGFGATLVADNFTLNGGWVESDYDKYVKSSAWRIGAGYNYRIWLNSSLFIDGAVGVQYTHAKVEYGEDKERDGNLGLFVTPKIGLRLFTWDEIDWGIQAGYRWDFQEFKFSKAYTADYFTIGIIGLF